ncbi:MAG TPA: hypothetical protein VNN21_04190 [Dehalococcoidia bacterium]|nr:hypothetical protein [Dehalococcoidia bacterium]
MESLVRRTLEQAQRVGSLRALALCHHALGAVLQLAGRWPESVRALNESISLCQQFGGTFGEVLGAQRLAQIETAVGLYEPAYRRLAAALEKARASDSPMVKAHSLGRIYASLSLNRYEAGVLTEATRYLARGFATQRVVGECAGCDVLLYPAAVPIYIAHGDLELAEESCRKAEETAGAFASRSWLATARYLVGLLALARGLSQAAADHFEEAASLFEAVGQPYEQARCLEGLAQARGRATDRTEAARELVERAAAIYLSLGAPVRAEKARSILSGGAGKGQGKTRK